MQPDGRKRRATDDAAEDEDYSDSLFVALPATQEVTTEFFENLWVLSSDQICSICETWLPETAQKVCLLDNPAHQKPESLSYRAMRSMMAMLLHMATMQQGGHQAEASAITDLVRSTVEGFYRFNTFEVDLHLLQEFFKAPSTSVDSQVVSKNTKHLIVVVQVQSGDHRAQLAQLLNFLDYNTTGIITIKFRGPGAKDGSDTKCQRKIAQLCGVINDILEKCQGQCTLNIVKELGLGISEYSIGKWFRKPSDEAVARFDNGTASYDECMQVQVAQWIREIKAPEVTELYKQEVLVDNGTAQGAPQ